MRRSIFAVAALSLWLAGGAWGQGVPGQGTLVPSPAPATSVPGAPGGAFAYNFNGCTGTVDDSAAINTLLSTIRSTIVATSGTAAFSINFPTQAKCSIGGGASGGGSSLNFTGFTKQNFAVNCNGAEFYGQVPQAAISAGPLVFAGSITGGSSYTNGFYPNVPLTGGSGTGATADITVAGGSVTVVTMVRPGNAYVGTDSLSVLAANVGGTGTGFAVAVGALGAPVVDALGSIGLMFNNCRIGGDATYPPNYGIQIGRINTTALDGGGSGTVFNNMQVSGTFYQAACYNFSGESVIFNDVTCANADTGRGSYSLVQDGVNHFGVTSQYVTELAPVETAQSFNGNTHYSGHYKSIGGVNNPSAIWTAGARSHSYFGTYGLNNTGSTCATIYNITAGLPQMSYWDLHCEGTNLTDIFLVNGTLASPVLGGWEFKDGALFSSNSIFKLGGSATTASIQNLKLQVSQAVTAVASTTKVFDSAKAWTVSGYSYVANSAWWNAPLSFAGNLVVGTQFNRPQIGPLDILTSYGCTAGAGYSAARQLSQTYLGPLIDVENTGGTITASIYPNSNGDLDLGAISVVLPGVTVDIAKLYDQTGQGAHMTDSTLADQPVLSLSVANLGNRPSMTFGDGTAVGLSVAAQASINGTFSTGGFVIAVLNQTGTPTTTDRIFQKTNSSWLYPAGGSAVLQLTQAAGGSWNTPALVNGGHVLDWQYSSASINNTPIAGYDGTTQTLASPTQPGSIGADTGTLVLGNNAIPASARGFPGTISEIIFAKCTVPIAANALDAVRRNMAAYYGLSSVN